MSKMLAILGYHKIGPWGPNGWETWFYVPTVTFAKHMAQLRDGGWTVIDAATLLRALESPKTLPDRAALITFDDGYVSVLEHAAPVLKTFGYPAIVFMPTTFAGRGSEWDANSPEPVEPICSWDQLRALEAGGLSIQSHSASHRSFSQIQLSEIDREARDSKATIERELGKPVTLLAYPFDDAGCHPESTAAALHRSGYRAAMHYVGGAMSWPVENCFHLTRIPIWPDSDLSGDAWLNDKR